MPSGRNLEREHSISRADRWSNEPGRVVEHPPRFSAYPQHAQGRKPGRRADRGRRSAGRRKHRIHRDARARHAIRNLRHAAIRYVIHTGAKAERAERDAGAHGKSGAGKTSCRSAQRTFGARNTADVDAAGNLDVLRICRSGEHKRNQCSDADYYRTDVRPHLSAPWFSPIPPLCVSH